MDMDRFEAEYGRRPRVPDDHLSSTPMERVRTMVWIGGGALLFVFAITATALALAVWGVVVATENRQRIDDVAEGSMVMRLPARDGQAPRWDTKTGGWVPGHGRLIDLEDVAVGPKHRPLEDGDLLGWERGRLVNFRNPVVSQRLADLSDVRFRGQPRTGDIGVYNGTAGQWQNVPLGSLLALDALMDVDAGSVRHGSAGSSLEYDGRRWFARGPHVTGMVRFCVVAQPSSDTPTDLVSEWGRLETPIQPYPAWTPIVPVAPKVDGGIPMQGYARGGVVANRRRMSLTTPAAGSSRPATQALWFVLRATMSVRGFPHGTLGFLVGPGTGVPLDDMQFSVDSVPGHMAQWSVETVREIGAGQEIRLAFQHSPSVGSTDLGTPLIQCMSLFMDEQ